MSAISDFKNDIDAFNRTLDQAVGSVHPNVRPYVKPADSRIGGVEKDVERINLVLSIPGKVNNTLSGISRSLTALETVLTAVSFVKQVKAVATHMKNQITALKGKITTAEKQLKKAEDAVKPYKTVTDGIEDSLEAIIQRAHQFRDELSRVSNALENAHRMTDFIPHQSTKATTQEQIDELARGCSTALQPIHAALTATLTEADRIEDYFDNQLMAAIANVDPLDNAVDTFEDQLAGLLDPLQDLDVLLNSSVSVKFPYPSPTASNPFRTKKHRLRVSMRIALKGAKTVEKEAKRILSNVLYEALEVFGLDKAVKSLMKSAEKGIEKLLDLIPFDLPIEIKALDTVDQHLDALIDEVEQIDTGMTADFSALASAIEGYDAKGKTEAADEISRNVK